MNYYRKLILLLFLIPALVEGQSKIELQDVSGSFMLPFNVQDDGGKIGVGFSYYKWNSSRTNKKGTSKTYNHQIYFEPQLGYLRGKNYYQSIFFNLETGWKWQREGRRSHSRLFLGLGYNLRIEAMTLVANFDGTSSVSEWEKRHFFFPNIGYQWAYRISDSFDLFAKASAGINFSGSHPNFKSALFELGVRYNFKSINP